MRQTRSYERQIVGRLLELLVFFLVLFAFGLSNLNLSLAAQGIEPVGFAVIGDGGTGDEHQRNVAEQMVTVHDRTHYQFVLMVGDNIYPSGSPGDYHEKFEVPYAKLLERGVKFYAALGNHDVRRSRWRDAIKYPKFNMGGHRYYTFAKGAGLAQFFALDSNLLAAGKRGEPQLRWFQAELLKSSARWRIVFFHHPIYSSGKRHGSNVKIREVVEPLLIQGGVQVVFSGHDHIYEHIAPQHGVAYFVTGAAGKLRRGNLDPRSGLTIKGNDQTRHFMYVEVDAREMRFQAISETGEVIDSGSIPAPSTLPVRPRSLVRVR